MNSSFILIFFLTLNIMGTLGMCYYSWRIMRMKLAPSLTWSLKLTAGLIQLVQLGWSIFYVYDIAKFLTQYSPESVIISYGLNAMRVALIFAFVVRIYYNLYNRYPQ